MDMKSTIKPFEGRSTHFAEYGDALRRHYPDVAAAWLDAGADVTPMRGERPGQRRVSSLESSIDQPDFEGRFEDPSQRKWRAQWPVYRRKTRWRVPGYKGLMLMKLPTDLMLYSHLIWELQPRTIIEFGSLQGASGLWFADQLAANESEAKVYSLDYMTKCVHPLARRNPRLEFLTVNLYDLKTLDTELLRNAPHPWLVTEDAHVNVFGLFFFLDKYMASGDYYVIEDAFIRRCKEEPDEKFLKSYRRIAELGYLVDTHYTDAYGYNATCAPNAWLRKS